VNKILSQEEIDALLASAASAIGRDTRSQSPRLDVTSAGGAIPYDSRRPDRVSKDQIRSLQFMHDRFARNLSTSLSAYLRTVTEVTVVSVEQCAYAEFLMSLPDVTVYYAVSLSPDLNGALEVNPGLALSIIDRMLGGTGTTPHPARALTEIEQNVVDAAVKLILENLTETWQSIVTRLDFQIQSRDTRPQMLQVVPPNEIVIVLAFDMKVGDTRGLFSLCVPASIIELAGSNLAKSWQRAQRLPTEDDERRLIGILSRVPLPVSARVDSTLAASDLADLKPGYVLSLGQPTRAPLQVFVGGTPKFKGRLAEVDGRGVITIVETITPPSFADAGA
jgi:flagellar motor switch protein FliM